MRKLLPFAVAGFVALLGVVVPATSAFADAPVHANAPAKVEVNLVPRAFFVPVAPRFVVAPVLFRPVLFQPAVFRPVFVAPAAFFDD